MSGGYIVELRGGGIGGYQWIPPESTEGYSIFPSEPKSGQRPQIGGSLPTAFRVEIHKSSVKSLIFKLKRPWESRAVKRLKVDLPDETRK